MFFRMIFGLPGAGVITALLFLAMGWMITQEAPPTKPPVDQQITILAQLEPTPIGPKITPKPPKFTPPEDTKIEFTNKSDGVDAVEFDLEPGPEPGEIGPPIDMTGTQPTLKIPPIYPENCRSRGAEGIVMVEFDVTPEGTVTSPRVIASENACLNRAAMQAVSKWKFTPKVDSSGRAVMQRGVRTSINFKLTQ